MIYVYTSCAMNFVPAAKALFRSVNKHLPNAKTVLILADVAPEGFSPETEDVDEIMSIEDFRDEIDELNAWIFCHNVMELATAVKPFGLARLLARDDCDAVLFFDCDCILYSDVSVVFEALERASIVLTPHATVAHARKDWMPFEMRTLKTGAFNLGFLGVGNTDTGREFAHWWREHLRYYCWIDFERGIFTDQKWMDLVPSYFDDYEVIRKTSLNVARWNTFQRTVVKTEEGTILVDGEPVDFIHFSGFYKIGAFVKGLYNDESAGYCHEMETLNALSEWYAEAVREDAERDICRAPWGYGFFEDGMEIEQRHREFFRERFEKLVPRFSNPFAVKNGGGYRSHFELQDPSEWASKDELKRRFVACRLRLEAIEASRSWKIAEAMSRLKRRLTWGRE